MVEAKTNFITCIAKRRVMIKKICLEEIVGFSFFAINIKIPEPMSISVKVKSHEKISATFKGEIRSSLQEEIIEIKIHTKKIMRLSILEILIGCFSGT